MIMEFRVLGPVEARENGSMVPVPLGMQTAVLAALLLRANRPVSIPELAEVLWASAPPRSARISVQNHVKRLRQALGEPGRYRIATRSAGYLIRVGAAELDLSRFEVHVTAALATAEGGLWGRCHQQARAALALWRGEPLANVQSGAFATREVPRLTERRLLAMELNIDASIHLGHYGEVIDELRQLTAAHPFRERFHGLLMAALYGDGRQAEALAAYQQARNVLVADLGLEPGPELRQLHRQILANDPCLPGRPPAVYAAAKPSVSCQLPATVPARSVSARSSRAARSHRFCKIGSVTAPRAAAR
jgi:DNA-binding SARP family transcriptional activator